MSSWGYDDLDEGYFDPEIDGIEDQHCGQLETRIIALERQVAELYKRLEGDGR